MLKRIFVSPLSTGGGIVLSIFSKLFCGACIASFVGMTSFVYGPLSLIAHYNLAILSILLISSSLVSLLQSNRSRFGLSLFCLTLFASCLAVFATALRKEVMSFSALGIVMLLSLIQLLVGRLDHCRVCAVHFSLSKKERLNEEI